MSDLHRFAHDLGISLRELALIKENPYCAIYKALSDEEAIIIKEYKEREDMAVWEAKAIAVYHELIKEEKMWMDCHVLKIIPKKKIIAMSFVPGKRMSDLIYESKHNEDSRNTVIQAAEKLGSFLRKTYFATCQQDSMSPFFYEYLVYCSEKLERFPGLGNFFFHSAIQSAQSIIQSAQSNDKCASFAHGDLVPRNIHISGERIGLVDFANSNPKSHLWNDFYNFSLAMGNMRISNAYRNKILHAFQSGIGDIPIQPEAIKQFYYEYNRRRWCMLKMYGKNPLEWIQFIRGYLSFARPYEENHGTVEH